MSEVKITEAITAVNPDKRVEAADPTHALIAAEAKKILENPFVQEQVGSLPPSSTSFKLEVTLGGAKVTLGARVIEDLTSKIPTSDLAPYKQEYIESCRKIIELLDSTSEITPEAEVLDLPTTPEKSEAHLKKIADLEDIIEAQQGLFSQMEAEINRLREAGEKREEIPTSSNQVFRFGSLATYLGLQDGELGHFLENDDLPHSQEELEIVRLQKQIATLQQQNAEAKKSKAQARQHREDIKRSDDTLAQQNIIRKKGG
ncbi:MAG: hypothetical protein ChlgKO_02480 [Chlamydiales bacterium]